MKRIILLFLLSIISVFSIPENCNKLWTETYNNQETSMYICKQNITITTTQTPTTTTIPTTSPIPAWLYELLQEQGWEAPSNNIATTSTTQPPTTQPPTTQPPTTQPPTTQHPTTQQPTQPPTTQQPTQQPTTQPPTTQPPTQQPIQSPTDAYDNIKNNSMNTPKDSKLKNEQIIIKQDNMIIIILGITCGTLLIIVGCLIIKYKCCSNKKEPISPGNITIKIEDKSDIENRITSQKISTLEPYKGKDIDILRKQSIDRKRNKNQINKEANVILTQKLPTPPNIPAPNIHIKNPKAPPDINEAKQRFKQTASRLNKKNRNSWKMPENNNNNTLSVQHLPPIAPINNHHIPTIHADVTINSKNNHAEFVLKQ